MKWAGVVIGGLVAVGAALRLMGVFDDFWFDEVWSWKIASEARSAGEIFSAKRARIDNNHPLNTLLMYWIGDRAYWPVYRLPTIVAGVGTVGLVARWLWKRFGRVEAGVGAALVGLSYPMIHYSSEARGYALMVLFAVAGFVALDEYLRKPGWGRAVAFWVCVVLGFVSHLTFGHFYLAALVWSAIELWRPRGTWVDLARCHGVPVVFAGIFYLTFVRGMTVGGAPDTSLWGVVESALSLMVGGSVIVGVVAIVGALVAVWYGAREFFAFLLTCVVVSPGVFVGMQAVSMRGMETLFPRYFLVSMVFAYVAMAIGLGVVWKRQKAVVLVLVGTFVGANVYQTVLFMRGGRGHYLDALTYMAARDGGTGPRVSSDNAFRTGMLLEFYGRYVPVEYVEPAAGAEWFIINATEAGVRPVGDRVVAGVKYRFEREFTYHGLSGWSWYLFRRAG